MCFSLCLGNEREGAGGSQGGWATTCSCCSRLSTPQKSKFPNIFLYFTIHNHQISHMKHVLDPLYVFFRPLVVHLHVVRLFQPSRNLHVLAPGGPREGGAPRIVSRYPCGYDDPCSGWVPLGGQPVLLQLGRLLSVYAAKRGIPGDGSVAFFLPGADPLGLRRLCTADFD